MKSRNRFVFSIRTIHPLVFFIILLADYSGAASVKNVPGDIDVEGMNLQETKLATIRADYDKWGSVFFTSDGRRVYYKASKEGRHFVVINDDAGKSYEAIDDRIVISPDGRRISYRAKRDEKEYLAIDGREVESFNEVAPTRFSTDSRLLAYEAEDKGRWFVSVTDGANEIHRSKGSDTCWAPRFSPDNRLLTYVIENKEKTVVFLDLATGKIIRERVYKSDQNVGGFAFSSDSSRVIYNLRKDGKDSLVLFDFTLDEEKEMEPPYGWTRRYILSPNGKTIYHVAIKKENKFHVIENPWGSPSERKEYGPYRVIARMLLVPGSETVAYHAAKGDKWLIVAGGIEGPEYDDMNALIISPGGASMAYPAMKGGKWVMVISKADNPAEVWEGPAFDRVSAPVFSPDGRYVAYVTGAGTSGDAGRLVVADREGNILKQGPVLDGIWPPVWSPDGKTVAYGARKGRELWWKVIDVELGKLR